MKASARKKNGKWIAFVELGYDANGKRKQITRVPSENSKYAAQELANELMAQYLNNTFYVEQKMIVADYMDMWLEQHKNNITYNTYNFYEGLSRIYIKPTLGHLQVTKLNSIQAEQFYIDLQKETKLSNSTVRKIHITLRAALQYGVKHKIIKENPCDNATVPKPKKFKPVVLDEEQLVILLQELKETSIFVPSMISIYAGLRRGEILGLTWDKVDIDNRILYVNAQLQRRKGKGVKLIEETKNESSERAISISDSLCEVLTQHKIEQNQYREMQGKQYFDSNFVCTFRDGKVIAPDYVTKRFKKVVDKLGFNGFRFHDLRHSFATLLITNGVDIKVISELLGHSSIRVTSDVYAHVLKPVQDAAVNKIKLDI